MAGRPSGFRIVDFEFERRLVRISSASEGPSALLGSTFGLRGPILLKPLLEFVLDWWVYAAIGNGCVSGVGGTGDGITGMGPSCFA